MDSFDPLFDDEILAQRPFSLSLPTFEFAPPSSTFRDDNDHSENFDQNVGTIALLGSHDSEHPQASSPLAPGSPGSKAPVKARPRSQRHGSQALQAQQPYAPQSLSDLVLGQLARDPNVVPLLQAIVEYVYKTNLVPAQSRLLKTSSAPSTGDSRPTKRRRLQRVPAGAEDWTVPFPFPQGEGPQHYQETWEMKRLIALLGSLTRNLKNWRGQHGTVSFTTQPRKRTYRGKQSSAPVQTPRSSASPAATTSPNDPFLDEAFLADLQIPNPADFDLSLESLLNVLTSYEGNRESALNVDLGALSNGAPISDIFFATPAHTEQAVPWENYVSFSNHPLSGGPSQHSTPVNQAGSQDVGMDLDFNSIGLSTYLTELMPRDTPELSHGSEKSTERSSQSGEDAVPSGINANQYQNLTFSGLGLDIPTPQALREQEAVLTDDELQDLLNIVLSSTSFTPSMTESPSIATPVDIGTPQMSARKRFDSTAATAASTSNPAQPISRTVAAVSKRGKGRTTAALRRNLNKQLRQNPAESIASNPGSIPVIPLPPQPGDGGAKRVKKMRATEATVKSRGELLERAKEWRELMAKELERARMARWEVTVEGMVLRELGILVRNGESGADVEMEE